MPNVIPPGYLNNVPLAVRHPEIDALRGLAMVWMTLYHACFDLAYFGFIQADFNHSAIWLVQRAGIVSLFMFCAGLGQAIASQQGLGWPQFWRRWSRIAACSLLVSAASWAMFPGSFIYFGVLHALAVMTILARCMAGWGRSCVALALAILAIYLLTPDLHRWIPVLDGLNEAPYNVLGLITRKPLTEDYVPLVPWLAPLCLGVAAAPALARRLQMRIKAGRHPCTLPSALRNLAWLGRHSLPYYMLHQPLLLGLLALARYLA